MRNWLKDLRLAKELTQENVANMAGVDVTTINKIELGERRPSPDTAKAIAQVLGFNWIKFYEENQKLHRGDSNKKHSSEKQYSEITAGEGNYPG